MNTGLLNHNAEAGIYTWCLQTDTLYADTLVARLFGLSAADVIKGLPIADYLARIHHADLKRVAALIAQAVIDGLPYQAEYRVFDAAGSVQSIMAFGRCFRDLSGEPAYYGGIVHPVSGQYLPANAANINDAQIA